MQPRLNSLLTFIVFTGSSASSLHETWIPLCCWNKKCQNNYIPAKLMVLGNRPLHAQFVQGTKGYVKVSFTRSSSRTTILSSMQTDPTLLTNNPQILLDVTCCVRLYTLLHVVGSSYAKFETGETFCKRTQHCRPTTPNIIGLKLIEVFFSRWPLVRFHCNNPCKDPLKFLLSREPHKNTAQRARSRRE